MSQQTKKITIRSVLTAAINAERAIGGVGTNLLKLAKSYDTFADFEKACKVQELWAKSEVAGQMQVIDLPDCWIQAKSDIKARWKQGGSEAIKASKSYHQLRDDKIKANKVVREAIYSTLPDKTEREVDTLQAALDDGSVIDAKTNQLVPDELKEFVECWLAMSASPLTQQGVTIGATEMAKTSLKLHRSNLKRAVTQRRGNQRNTNSNKAAAFQGRRL